MSVKIKKPIYLTVDFEDYRYNFSRDFLDALGDFSEKVSSFPDISFGKTYANITIRPSENNENEEISNVDHEFASQINLLIQE